MSDKQWTISVCNICGEVLDGSCKCWDAPYTDVVVMPVAPVIPASEYDALVDVLHALVAEYTMEAPIEAVEHVRVELGRDAAEMVRRILIDGAYARDLFAHEENTE